MFRKAREVIAGEDMEFNVPSNFAPAGGRILGALRVIRRPEKHDPSRVLSRNKGLLEVAIGLVRARDGRGFPAAGFFAHFWRPFSLPYCC